MSKILPRVSFALSLATGPALAGALYYLYTQPLPKPVIVALPLPERAEVRPAEAVTPGTFKIKVSLQELLERAKTSTATTLVSWGRGDTLRNTLSVKYWLPRGDSTFFHAASSYRINWPIGVCTYSWARTSEGIVVTPGHADGWTGLTIAGLVVYASILAMIGLKRYHDRHWV